VGYGDNDDEDEDDDDDDYDDDGVANAVSMSTQQLFIAVHGIELCTETFHFLSQFLVRLLTMEFLDNWRMSALKLQVLMGKVACKIPSVSKEQILVYRRFMIEKDLSQMSSDVKWCQMPLALYSQKS